MPIQRHNRVFTLPHELWQALEQLAAKLNARNRTGGPFTNQTSITALLKGIADGTYVVDHNPRLRQDLKRLDEAIAENEKRAKTPQRKYEQLSLEPEAA